ncbi:MAG TPA: class I SAM-dependent methyltransferase [Thermodesulfobacteriota bacterium]|nr:class I SAM-dependent methyltransferase [Deltaproteobacteria bacterium]HNR11974.1 class I SAM-dependent methyltransferase [Thermodesulfobacteriota bacterium]HNU71723.1 class I SAM-dependent methyltransferase [Thermodesulfobacteriota bacterium]HOC38409.1 class I SAM-dependent methyltransferase [Thermodesulfobacteriota bacterium]
MIESVVACVSAFPTDVSPVLDAGCGTGNFSLALGRRGEQIVGFDSAFEMLAALKMKSKRQKILVPLVQGDLNEPFPFQCEAFGCVVSINALYMLKRPQGVLREMHRVLRTGGKLLLCHPRRQPRISESAVEIVNTEGYLKGAAYLCRLFALGLFNLVIARRVEQGRYFFWNEDQLREELNEAGFAVDHVEEAYTAKTNLFVVATVLKNG